MEHLIENNTFSEDRFLDLIGDLGDEYVILPIKEDLAEKCKDCNNNLRKADSELENKINNN